MDIFGWPYFLLLLSLDFCKSMRISLQDVLASSPCWKGITKEIMPRFIEQFIFLAGAGEPGSVWGSWISCNLGSILDQPFVWILENGRSWLRYCCAQQSRNFHYCSAKRISFPLAAWTSMLGLRCFVCRDLMTALNEAIGFSTQRISLLTYSLGRIKQFF